jgi:uncharacterized protein (UPF0335 family)
MASPTVAEFIERLTSIENEQKLLAEDRKALVEEFKEKIDMKALMAAIKIVKIKSKLGASENECDTYIEEIDGRIA